MRQSVILLAHNIRSLWNIGSLFRSADCFGVEKIYLTGYTGTPPRREISKSALGAEQWIPWEHTAEPLPIIAQLKADGWTIVALEITKAGTALSRYQAPAQCCLIVGNEVLGVPPELLQASDHHVYIPMQGKKESLNVSVAAGIALAYLSRNK